MAVKTMFILEQTTKAFVFISFSLLLRLHSACEDLNLNCLKKGALSFSATQKMFGDCASRKLHISFLLSIHYVIYAGDVES